METDASGKVRVWSWDNPEHILKIEVRILTYLVIRWSVEGLSSYYFIYLDRDIGIYKIHRYKRKLVRTEKSLVSLTGPNSTIFPTFATMCLQTQVFAGEVKDLEWDSESKRIVAVGESQGTVR